MTSRLVYVAISAALAAGVMPAPAHSQERHGHDHGSGGDSARAAPKDRDEDGQSPLLPPLPRGMTLDMIRQGDAIFRGKGGCTSCHGTEATGMPADGSSLTTGLHFISADWRVIDSLITDGIPEAMTRTPVAMPPRGEKRNLTREEVRRVAAYVWAISQTRGEPWLGGHRVHPDSGEEAGGHKH